MRSPPTAANEVYLSLDNAQTWRKQFVATRFDRAAVFGVHPTDAGFVIAPDIVAGNVKVTRDGGDTWPVDDSLTNLVLQGGELPMYSANPFYMQVTHIGFDPYRPDRIFVGTRDAGIACSADRGATWRLIPGSERITYVTGFHFFPSGVAHASAYGRGLWTLLAHNATCADAAFVQPPLPSNRPLTAAAARRRPAPKDGAPAPARPVPRLWFGSSLPPAGAQLVGPDALIVLRGERFTAHAGKRLPIVLDKQQRVGEAVPDANGSFLVRLHLPQIAKGTYRLQVLSDERAGWRLASVEFARVSFPE
jgi:hypothetical protein